MAAPVNFTVSVSHDSHGTLLHGFPATYWFLNGHYARLSLVHRSCYLHKNEHGCHMFQLENGRAGICGTDALNFVLQGRDYFFVESARQGDLSEWSAYGSSSIDSTVPENVAGEADAKVSLTTPAAKPAQVADTLEQVVGPAAVPNSRVSTNVLSRLTAKRETWYPIYTEWKKTSRDDTDRLRSNCAAAQIFFDEAEWSEVCEIIGKRKERRPEHAKEASAAGLRFGASFSKSSAGDVGVREKTPSPKKARARAKTEESPAKKVRGCCIDTDEAKSYYYNDYLKNSDDPLRVRLDSPSDFKVIVEIFKNQAYKMPKDLSARPVAIFNTRTGDRLVDGGSNIGASIKWFLDHGVSQVDGYEPQSADRPEGTWSQLVGNMGRRSTVSLHQAAIVHSRMAMEVGSFDVDIASAMLNKAAYIEVASRDGTTFYLKQERGLQWTVVMCSDQERMPYCAAVSLNAAHDGDALEQLNDMQQKGERLQIWYGPAMIEVRGAPDKRGDGKYFSTGAHAWEHGAEDFCIRNCGGSWAIIETVVDQEWVATEVTLWVCECSSVPVSAMWRCDSSKAHVPSLKIQPMICFADLDECTVGMSWKSSISTSCTYRTGMAKRAQYWVPVTTLKQAIRKNHTIVKLDIEGGEMSALGEALTASDWKSVRMLVFEYSVARSRKFALGWHGLAIVLKRLRQAQFSHVYIPRECWNPKWWKSGCSQTESLDSLIFAYRESADPDAKTVLKSLPSSLGDSLRTKWLQFAEVMHNTE